LLGNSQLLFFQTAPRNYSALTGALRSEPVSRQQDASLVRSAKSVLGRLVLNDPFEPPPSPLLIKWRKPEFDSFWLEMELACLEQTLSIVEDAADAGSCNFINVLIIRQAFNFPPNALDLLQ
jgi:hypothetical protein